MTDFQKITQLTNFMKIHPVGAGLFHEVKQTDKHNKANGRFLLFCEMCLKTRLCKNTTICYFQANKEKFKKHEFGAEMKT